MTEEQKVPPLLMVKEGLADLPELGVPAGYTVRCLRSGEDKAAWDAVIDASFGGEHDFAKEMEADDAYRMERVWFVADDRGMPVATASAWYRPQWPEDTGYLHMVGLLPEHAGRKLGYVVCLAALLQMADEGRTRTVLHTDDFRLPAIKTYLNLGFMAMLADSSHPGRWKDLAGKLNVTVRAVDSDGGLTEIAPDN